MAEEILSVLVEIVLSKLGSIAVQQIGLAWGVKKELQKLEKKISTIRNILSDAEEKQIKNSTVKGWLGSLKTVIYDADDLLDKVTTEALRKKVETHQSKVREGLKRLEALALISFPELVTLPKGLEDAADTLTHLVIYFCRKMTSLSDSVLPKLQSLRIEGCPDLKRRYEEGGEDWPKIAHIPDIRIDVSRDMMDAEEA